MTYRLALLSLAAACWTETAPDPVYRPPPAAPAPPCPERLVGIVHEAATLAPIAGATVVIETSRGSVATELTDGLGRFETAAVAPPARVRIYHGDQAVEHPLEPCQQPLRIGIPPAPPGR
jgi:hypothetical protein